ncbi:MAG: Gfo/Idh/MocA family oxidoreductase [Pirellulaceae bacterium]|nr:Gfo/Idh/MocA family oxidoreductase [Pirellulaceae bacterium]
MKLRVGLLGLSVDWNTRHLPALRTLQDRFEVVGVYSSVTAFADTVAREFETRRFDGYRELARQENVDAVLLLESQWYGILPILAACDFGKAVYCGSDIDFDPQQATAVRQEVDRAGIAFMAEFPRRFAPASLRLKELIATRLGPPQILFCHKRLNCEQDGTRGRTPQARADRELMELLDWCAFIVGRSVRSVQCIQHARYEQEPCGEPVVDYRSLSVDFSEPDAPLGTTVAQISCGTYIPNSWHEAIAYRPPAAVQVRCENGLAFVDLPNGLVWFDQAGRHQESLDSERAVGQQLLTQFHRAVTSLVRKMGDLDDVYHCLRALQAARQSVQERRAIDLS